MRQSDLFSLFFFFNDTATTEIYTLSLHDALPIWRIHVTSFVVTHERDLAFGIADRIALMADGQIDRKSTRLNSSHLVISYAVFCLKKKKKITHHNPLEVHIALRHSATDIAVTHID